MAKKILVIEDEQYLRELYEIQLSRAGYDVDTAADGEEGLQKTRKLPDLILLDIMLPKMNGVDILKHVMADPDTKLIPVVMLTNLGQESVLDEAMRLGAREYLIKLQQNAASLLHVVEKYIGTEIAPTTQSKEAE